VWPDHRPAEPDPARTGVGSRQITDSTPFPDQPGAAFLFEPEVSRGVSRATLVIVTALVSLIVTACSAQSPSVAPSTAGAPPATAATPIPVPATAVVRLALDWTPNTNHTGFYVAQQNGWYRDAAIDLQFLPYASTSPETLVSAGGADCGISTQEGATFAIAAGAKERSVMAILQHTATEIATRDDGSVTRPRDLDGKLYAGFGLPQEVPELQAVIRADGGSGDFRSATLDTAAYEALYSGKADFTITYSAWEALEAAERGVKLRTFAFTDYGLPDSYAVVLVCNDDWLAAQPDAARRFLAASVRGFELAATDPVTASARLVAANPGVFDANPKLPADSARFLADHDLYLDAEGRAGRQTGDQWAGFSGFLYGTGLLAGPDGKPLTTKPDFSTYFSNDYLP
jgi:ABC-type nitrate/sulfonate/bicarbonate transport system substrate-binding protein